MKNSLWIVYAAQTVVTQEAGRVIGFDKELIWDLGWQLVNSLLLILGVVVIVLAVIALRIYIKKNKK